MRYRYLICWLALLPPHGIWANPLQDSIFKGDHRQLKQQLAAGADADQRMADGSLLIAWAIERQDPDAVALLIEAGAEVNDRSSTGNLYRPLIAACLHPHDAVLDQLLAAEVDVNVRGPQGIPALSLCAGHASLAVVKRLLASGAEVNAKTAQGQTALMWAAKYARPAIFKELLAHGADIRAMSSGGFTPLMFAVKSGNAEIAHLALAMGGDASDRAPDGTSLVQLAMLQKNYEFAASLIDAGADINAYDINGHQLLHTAVAANQPQLVRQLIDKGADLNATTRSPKIRWRYESNFRAGDYEFPVLPPLLLAAQNGAAQIMLDLAAHGADPAYRSADGANLLTAAASSGHPQTLAHALRLWPQVNAADDRGNTALHHVLMRATGPALENMLTLLAEHGAHVNIENKQGKTAAQIAQEPNFKARPLFLSLFEPEKHVL